MRTIYIEANRISFVEYKFVICEVGYLDKNHSNIGYNGTHSFVFGGSIGMGMEEMWLKIWYMRS